MSFHLFAIFCSSHVWACSCKSLGFLLEVHGIEMFKHRWIVTPVVYAVIDVVAQSTLKCCLDHSNSPRGQEACFTCGSVTWDFGHLWSLLVLWKSQFWLVLIELYTCNKHERHCKALHVTWSWFLYQSIGIHDKKLDLQSLGLCSFSISASIVIDWVHCAGSTMKLSFKLCFAGRTDFWRCRGGGVWHSVTQQTRVVMRWHVPFRVSWERMEVFSKFLLLSSIIRNDFIPIEIGLPWLP